MGRGVLGLGEAGSVVGVDNQHNYLQKNLQQMIQKPLMPLVNFKHQQNLRSIRLPVIDT